MLSNDLVAVTPEGEIFGKTLKRLREGRGISQEKLANSDRLGSASMTTNYLSDLERGLKVPSLTTILKLAHALDCPVADLLADFPPSVIKKLVRNIGTP